MEMKMEMELWIKTKIGTNNEIKYNQKHQYGECDRLKNNRTRGMEIEIIIRIKMEIKWGLKTEEWG